MTALLLLCILVSAFALWYAVQTRKLVKDAISIITHRTGTTVVVDIGRGKLAVTRSENDSDQE